MYVRHSGQLASIAKQLLHIHVCLQGSRARCTGDAWHTTQRPRSEDGSCIAPALPFSVDAGTSLSRETYKFCISTTNTLYYYYWPFARPVRHYVGSHVTLFTRPRPLPPIPVCSICAGPSALTPASVALTACAYSLSSAKFPICLPCGMACRSYEKRKMRVLCLLPTTAHIGRMAL